VFAEHSSPGVGLRANESVENEASLASFENVIRRGPIVLRFPLDHVGAAPVLEHDARAPKEWIEGEVLRLEEDDPHGDGAGRQVNVSLLA
jgi:hypothetical protein